MNDGRELKYRTKKVDVKQLNLNVKLMSISEKNHQYYTIYYILYTYFGTPCIYGHNTVLPKIPRQNNFIIARAMSTFLMILYILTTKLM